MHASDLASTRFNIDIKEYQSSHAVLCWRRITTSLWYLSQYISLVSRLKRLLWELASWLCYLLYWYPAGPWKTVKKSWSTYMLGGWLELILTIYKYQHSSYPSLVWAVPQDAWKLSYKPHLPSLNSVQFTGESWFSTRGELTILLPHECIYTTSILRIPNTTFRGACMN